MGSMDTGNLTEDGGEEVGLHEDSVILVIWK